METDLKNLKIKNSSSIKKQFQLGTETVGTGTIGTGTVKQFQNSSNSSDSSGWYDHPRLELSDELLFIKSL